jgi:TonB-linked SusC/RagA family outer membrane protein
MQKRHYLKAEVVWISLFFMLFSLSGLAQNSRSISGIVTGENGNPLIGATLRVAGTSNGTTTNAEGNFSLNISSNDEILEVTYVGYSSQEVGITASNYYAIELSTEAFQLDELVVTALGITREKKALGYAVQEVDGEKLTQARETNLVSALAGRVAGVNVTGGSNSIGGSSRVVIRGETSLAGNNQPLFVVDGMPINNQVSAIGQSGQTIDYGNAASEINPDDIESISVLKGPNAAALYGSRAANGVILITTKSGKGTKGIGVSVNSVTSFESPLRLPDYQNEYGQGRGGVYNIGDGGRSWGPPLDGRQIAVPVNTEWPPSEGEIVTWEPYPDNVKEFYETGHTFTNNVALTAGNDQGNIRLSWTNLSQTGMVPNTDLTRNTVAVNTGYKLTEKLRFNAAVNYIHNNSDNRPVVAYGNESVAYTWIWEGRQVRTDKMRDYWVKGLEGVQPFTYNFRFNDNPYYTVYENLNGVERGRWVGNVSLNYDITPELSLMLRTGLDQSNERLDTRRTPGSNAYPLGQYRQDRTFFQERNSDFLLTYDRRLNNDWSIKLSAGGNQMTQRNEYLSTRADQLSVPGIYNLGNSRIPLVNNQFDSKYRINSIYAFGQVAYKNAIYLDVSARNDWSSSLPQDNNSYFYPSVSLSGVISEFLDLSPDSKLSFAKIRASWAQVGNDTRPYRLRDVYNYGTPWGSDQAVSLPSTIANANLVPESISTFEIGADLRFFNSRLGLDVTYYNTSSKNQILNIPIDLTSGFTSRFLNAGEIRSQGLEVMLNLTPINVRNGLRWDVNINWSTSRAEVIELVDGLDTYELPSRYVSVQARVGERMGDMYDRGYLRDPQGNIIHLNGLPQVTNELIKVGNYNPDWMAGINNSFSFKGFRVSALVDWRQGGEIFSYLNQRGNQAGQLIESVQGRETGVVGEGVIANGDGTYRPNDVNVSAERYWGSNYFDGEGSVFDATYVKLREVIIGYTIPNKVFGNTGIRDLTIQLVGRNLILWTDVPHFDPDTTGISGGTILPGIEDMSLPTPRSIGFNIGFSF